MTLKIEWVDSKREPKCQPDPAYPEGKDIKLFHNGEHTCHVKLPYPAKRCGYFIVDCTMCKLRTLITTAGRPDDPRSLTVPCAELKH